jgi:hypothetical protein
MNKLFNHNFFRFTLGFLSILLMSFALAAIVAHLDNTASQPASAVRGE